MKAHGAIDRLREEVSERRHTGHFGLDCLPLELIECRTLFVISFVLIPTFRIYCAETFRLLQPILIPMPQFRIY
jgi:hypothetical protein